jgi:large subunit ribosomal protein L15
MVPARSLSTTLSPRVKLTDLINNPGNNKARKRKGRGVGSGLGKTSGRGHKGQGRGGPGPFRGFEGGQTPLYRLMPKRGFTNAKFKLHHTEVNVNDIQRFVDMGRLSKEATINMRDLMRCGLISRIKHGVKLLGNGASELSHALNIEVSRASKVAVAAVEAAGGSVTCVHYNRVGLRSLLKPEAFVVLPKLARPPPRLMPYYLDFANRGYLSPEIQLKRQIQKLSLLER